MKSPHFHIIFRTCDVVHSLHNTPRPFNADKKTLIKKCFLSLLESLQGVDHEITILGDKLSDELVTFFRQYPYTLILGDWGNDESLRQSMKLAFNAPDDDWVYLCEDDYLHSKQAFNWIIDFIEHKDQYITTKRFLTSIGIRNNLRHIPIIIHPTDYPDRYKSKYLRFSLIFLSRFCHWRQVTDTTFTFMAQGKTFKKYRSIFWTSCTGANDRYLSKKLYAGVRFGNKALCLSPMPGVATHMHEEVMTPLVDWKQIYDSIDIEK
jgi:hypothetical protein